MIESVYMTLLMRNTAYNGSLNPDKQAVMI